MVINYLLLLPALVLLWIPRQAFGIGKTVIKETRNPIETDPRKTRSPGDISLRFTEEAVKPRNYLEFLRALAGGYLLGGTDAIGAAISVAPHAPAAVARELLLAVAAILVIGTVIQTLRFDGRSRLFPPAFYLTGIAVVLAGWKAALFATILAWMVNRSVSSPTGFFAAFAVLLAGFGFVFDGKSLYMFLACALLILPAALSLLSGRPLIAMSRKTREVAD
jgi:hypothetical protein